MRLPYFKSWDSEPIHIDIIDGITEFGDDNVILTWEGKCNFNEKTKTVRNADGQLVQLNASLTIGCDIAPSQAIIMGHAVFKGRKWSILESGRPRNPDGSVNHTYLGLI